VRIIREASPCTAFKKSSFSQLSNVSHLPAPEFHHQPQQIAGLFVVFKHAGKGKCRDAFIFIVVCLAQFLSSVMGRIMHFFGIPVTVETAEPATGNRRGFIQ
jgi:hypothetical protein